MKYMIEDKKYGSLHMPLTAIKRVKKATAKYKKENSITKFYDWQVVESLVNKYLEEEKK